MLKHEFGPCVSTFESVMRNQRYKANPWCRFPMDPQGVQANSSMHDLLEEFSSLIHID